MLTRNIIQLSSSLLLVGMGSAQDVTVVADWELSEVGSTQPPDWKTGNWFGGCGVPEGFNWSAYIVALAETTSGSGAGDAFTDCDDDPAGPFEKTASSGMYEHWVFLGSAQMKIGHLEGAFDGEASGTAKIGQDSNFTGWFMCAMDYDSNTIVDPAVLEIDSAAVSSDPPTRHTFGLTTPLGGVWIPLQITNSTGPAEVSDSDTAIWPEFECTNVWIYQFGTKTVVHVDPMPNSGEYSWGEVFGEYEAGGTVILSDLNIGSPQCP